MRALGIRTVEGGSRGRVMAVQGCGWAHAAATDPVVGVMYRTIYLSVATNRMFVPGRHLTRSGAVPLVAAAGAHKLRPRFVASLTLGVVVDDVCWSSRGGFLLIFSCIVRLLCCRLLCCRLLCSHLLSCHRCSHGISLLPDRGGGPPR